MLKKAISSVKHVARNIQVRPVGDLSAKRKINADDKMQAWQIHSYRGPGELKLSDVRMPVISKPTDVLIRVEAASVNPIDVAMTRGYGATVLNLMRKARNLPDLTASDLELPLTLGRDFSGVIVSKGHGIGDKLQLGDEVWGVVPVEQQGCHSTYVVVDSNLVDLRPQNISYIEAASILYAGLTAWSALWITGGLCYKISLPARINKRILVLGASGGVGSLAVQLLKAWNMQVIATCSTDAVNLVESLGADMVIDYKEGNADSEIINEGPYDIILDCANQGPDRIKSKGYPHNSYITLNSPVLRNVDELGLIGGTAKNVADIIKHNISICQNKSSVKWAFFVPSRTGMNMLQKLVENNEIRPVIEEVYPFEELPLAYDRITKGHLRGKLVINMR